MLVRSPPTPERLAARARKNLTVLRFTCDGCGKELAQIKQRVFETAPATSKTLVLQAQKKHKAETGCSGMKQEGMAQEIQEIAGQLEPSK